MINPVWTKPNHFALITSATSSIGTRLAHHFAKDNCNLVLISEQKEKNQQLAEDIGRRFGVSVVPMVKTLGVNSAALEVYNDLCDMGIVVDYLANIAGPVNPSSFLATHPETDQDTLQLNIISFVSFTKYFLRGMVKRNKGTIFHIPPAVIDEPAATMCCAMREFILAFSAGVAQEVKDTNVTVMSIQPENLHDPLVINGGIYFSEKDSARLMPVGRAGSRYPGKAVM